MSDDPKHNPGEPQFGEGHGGEHNPGEPRFGEEAFGDSELDRDDTHAVEELGDEPADADEAAEIAEGHS